jgi:tripartite-type tricarboxylate transporter receptor subunit TctC
MLVVRQSLPINSVKELMDYARNNPDKFSLATGGAASINHLISELLQLRTGLKWTQVHYRGNAPALNDIVGGHVDAGFGQLANSPPSYKAASSVPWRLSARHEFRCCLNDTRLIAMLEVLVNSRV